MFFSNSISCIFKMQGFGVLTDVNPFKCRYTLNWRHIISLTVTKYYLSPFFAAKSDLSTFIENKIKIYSLYGSCRLFISSINLHLPIFVKTHEAFWKPSMAATRPSSSPSDPLCWQIVAWHRFFGFFGLTSFSKCWLLLRCKKQLAASFHHIDMARQLR